MRIRQCRFIAQTPLLGGSLGHLCIKRPTARTVLPRLSLDANAGLMQSECKVTPRNITQRKLVAHHAHFIIAAVGTAGDTLPLIELARELAAAGHDVDFLALDAFAEPAQRAGLTYHRVGPVGLYDELARDQTIWFWHSGFHALWKYLVAALPDTVAQVERLRKPNTVLVASSGAVGLRMAQEKFDLPLATVHMSPFYFFSRHANVLGGLGAWPRWAPMWLRAVAMNVIDRLAIDDACRADVNRVRATMGLAPVRHVFTRWAHSPHRVICAVPAWFAPPQADWPAQAVSAAFPMSAPSAPWTLSDKLAEFLALSVRPIVFSAGTGAGAAVTFFHRAVEFARITGRKVILITRWPEQLPQPLPENVCHIDFAPFDQLLPHAAALVHNGGIGTMALAMQAGIPQIVIPFAYDQFYNGARLEALRGGIVLRRQRSEHELAVAIETVLTSPDIHAGVAANQQRMQTSAGGAAEMRAQVEALILPPG
jgi:rhamnosyltransferase subunit B